MTQNTKIDFTPCHCEPNQKMCEECQRALDRDRAEGSENDGKIAEEENNWASYERYLSEKQLDNNN